MIYKHSGLTLLNLEVNRGEKSNIRSYTPLQRNQLTTLTSREVLALEDSAKRTAYH